MMMRTHNGLLLIKIIFFTVFLPDFGYTNLSPQFITSFSDLGPEDD